MLLVSFHSAHRDGIYMDRRGSSSSGLTSLGFGVLAFNSVLAIYTYWGDASSVGFVLLADAARSCSSSSASVSWSSRAAAAGAGMSRSRPPCGPSRRCSRSCSRPGLRRWCRRSSAPLSGGWPSPPSPAASGRSSSIHDVLLVADRVFVCFLVVAACTGILFVIFCLYMYSIYLYDIPYISNYKSF